MQLRGQRYGENCDAEFHEHVASLRTRTYEEACYLYAEIEGKLTREQTAFLACNDRFYFLTVILGRVDAINPWIYERCRMVEREPDGYLDLWARYHYKTSIITMAGSLQEIACNPDVTIALFSVTKKVARKFGRGIQETMEKNQTLPAVFPDVFWTAPRKQAPMWNLEEGLTVIRKTTRNEPTFSVWGLVDGMPTGGHWDILLYNDVITEKTVTNQEMVAKATVAYELSTNLGIGEDTRRRMEGTRYSFADTYGFLIEKGIVKPRLFPATHDGKDGDYRRNADGSYMLDANGDRLSNAVFISLKHWQQVKIDQRSTYAAQMLQDPRAGKQQTFLPATLRRYLMRPRTLNVYIMGDYASGEKKDKKTDYSAILVIGIDHAGNKFFLDGARYRMTLTERWGELKRLYNRWIHAPGVQMIRVGYERYGAQSDIQYFEDQMKKPGEPKFTIIELNWPREGLGSKAARIQRMEPDFTANKFYLPAKVWRQNATWWLDRFGREHAGIVPPGVDAVQKSGARICLWRVDAATDKIDYRPIPLDPDRAFAPMLTEDEQEAMAVGESYRIIEALRRRDGTTGTTQYDLTVVFMEEFIFDPFSLHDDVIDCASRIYDMEPAKAELLDMNALEHEDWSD